MHKYVEFEKKQDGNRKFLHITLTDEGRKTIAESLEQNDGNLDVLSPDDVLWGFLEHQLCNGWEIIRPEEIGALTDAPIISDSAERDDYGKLVNIKDVYAWMDYQVRSCVADLHTYGYADWVYSGNDNYKPALATQFGPQEPVTPQIVDGKPAYYDCGICGHNHPLGWNGDCRDDANRFTAEQLDQKHGENGWEEVPMPGTCSRCEGEGRIPDKESPESSEDGKMPCPHCEGEGTV